MKNVGQVVSFCQIDKKETITVINAGWIIKEKEYWLSFAFVIIKKWVSKKKSDERKASASYEFYNETNSGKPY